MKNKRRGLQINKRRFFISVDKKYKYNAKWGVTGRKRCDSFVCPTQESFCETTNFDEQFWNLSVTKACSFYHNIILAKLFSSHIKKENESVLLSVLDMLQ